MTTTPALRHHDNKDDDEGVARAWTVLEAVPDPEIPVVSIRELGILRAVRRACDGALEVVVTPTYSGCPAMWQIAEDIGHTLDAARLTPYRIETVLAPAWTTDWIDADAREKLRAYGIAPPIGQSAAVGDNNATAHARADEKVIRFAPREAAASAATSASPARTAPTPPCPHCGSPHTERLAQFGSTACKALYRCVDCREPFDYFKPY
ncbi:1,2-phenylacetyl-CoA epoxidase subunit PaaD [Paraburkholderia sp. SARCC-3016]|jgi:ring-1,2-phenylacetyl-CoA epoxidase subunit PaaD|uniref:1,2-phenylacetyl-CoA epoxidase subunit PaaD n=1 Tax=Paraburkholderia sp. SARCC-3016 TaxID=3058611 RepID=UPI00280A0A6E|nr:1,2-phenylacetyl-CoA epoxidase subunit PaaD [Paraburkholderia sp. SARCC-3016]MDQ7980888.1 1,2-phenylacetyl-CoA epoxidase subunit PaaD [Paraburkholderia sp. SARCC-3016]